MAKQWASSSSSQHKERVNMMDATAATEYCACYIYSLFTLFVHCPPATSIELQR
jgi:hypothetical protein